MRHEQNIRCLPMSVLLNYGNVDKTSYFKLPRLTAFLRYCFIFHNKSPHSGQCCPCNPGQCVMADKCVFCVLVLPVTQFDVKSSSLPV